MSDVFIDIDGFFGAVGDLRGPLYGDEVPSNAPDVLHGGANQALGAMWAVANTLPDAIRAQRHVIANAFTLIGLDVIEADCIQVEG